MKQKYFLLVLAAMWLSACGGDPAATPTPPAPTAVSSVVVKYGTPPGGTYFIIPSPTRNGTATQTATVTSTPTRTRTPTATRTATVTPTRTWTPSPTPTLLPTITAPIAVIRNALLARGCQNLDDASIVRWLNNHLGNVAEVLKDEVEKCK